MLLQFNYENHQSFRDYTSFDMTALNLKEFRDRVNTVGNERVLTCAVIFGSNACGKSNFIDAFSFMKDYVQKPLKPTNSPAKLLLQKPFLLDDSSPSSSSLYEVYFIDSKNNTTYNYGFKLSDFKIEEEWLNIISKEKQEPSMVFYRNLENSKILFDKISKRNKKLINSVLTPDTLIVTLGARYEIPILQDVYDWFENIYILDSRDQLKEIDKAKRIVESLQNSKNQERLVSYLSSIDPTIRGLNIGKGLTSQPLSRIKLLHSIAGGRERLTSFDQESTGIQTLICLYPLLSEVLKDGGILILDSKDLGLHSLILRNIILAFISNKQNPNHAQIILVTQDMSLMTKELLRRDEIWFIDKDFEGVSNLYSLSDIFDKNGKSVSEEEDYRHNYFLGKYGAIPELKNINFGI